MDILIVLVFIGAIFMMMFENKVSSSSPLFSLLEKAVRLRIFSPEQASTIFDEEKEKIIAVWLKKKLITPEQAEDLRHKKIQKKPLFSLPPFSFLDFSFAQIDDKLKISENLQQLQNKVKENTKNIKQLKSTPDEQSIQRLIWGASAFGAICIGLGLVAVIASNWHLISSTIKLSAFFALFAGSLVGLSWSFAKQKLLVGRIFSLLNIFFVAGGIGLIGQVFHLNGPFENAFFLWVLLSAPFFYSFSLPRFRIFWCVLYCIGAFYSNPAELGILFLIGIIPFVGNLPEKGGLSFVWWISLLCIIGDSSWLNDLYRKLIETQLLLAAFFGVGGLLGCVYFLCKRFLPQSAVFTSSFLKGIAAYVLGGVLWMDILYSRGIIQQWVNKFDIDLFSFDRFFVLLGIILSGLILPFLGALIARFSKQKELYLSLLVGAVICFSYSFITIPFFGILFTLLLLIAGGVWAVRQNKISLFNSCLGLMFVRIFVGYIVFVSSLNSMGLGLILLGSIIFVCLLFYIKGRPLFIRLIQKETGHE